MLIKCKKVELNQTKKKYVNMFINNRIYKRCIETMFRNNVYNTWKNIEKVQEC